MASPPLLPPVTSSGGAHKVQQPKPQALPSRSGPSSILVSPRQKGNPVLNHVKSISWEYSDIPADYVVGQTACVLFLSLKYHRLHPEYIYSRITALAGKYNLRIVLAMVDIQNHEESLKELSKTSLVNNVTIVLAWSAQEAGRYLELFKTYEHAAPTSIQAQQSTTYSDKLIDFVTVPRSINKTDAVGLVSNFGSIRTAVNASPEEIALIAGWGEKKVKRWCNSVRAPFRVQKPVAITKSNERRSAAVSQRRHVGDSSGQPEPSIGTAPPVASRLVVDANSHKALEPSIGDPPGPSLNQSGSRLNHQSTSEEQGSLSADAIAPSRKRKTNDDEGLTEGMKAALAKFRQPGQ